MSTPRAHRSAAEVWPRDSTTSGARYLQGEEEGGQQADGSANLCQSPGHAPHAGWLVPR